MADGASLQVAHDERAAAPGLRDELHAEYSRLQYLSDTLERRMRDFEAQLAASQRSESALREVARVYQDVVEHATDAIFLLDCSDAAPRFVAVNAAFEKAVGVHRTVLTGRAVEEVLSYELCAEFLVHWRRCMATGKAMHYEGTLHRPVRRRSFAVTIVPVFDDNGAISRVAGIAHDITARKAAEAVLRAREEEMTVLVEHSPDHTLRIDRQGRVIYINPSMLRTLNLPRHQVWGRPIEELLAGQNHPSIERYMRALWQVIATGMPVELDIVGAPDRRGRRRHEHVHLVPEQDADGNTRSVISIGRDFTEQKELEHQLQQREATFRELVENSPDSISRYDRGLRRVYANPGMLDLLGDAAAAIGSTPSEVPGGPSFEQYEQELSAVFADGQERDMELRWTASGRPLCTLVRMRPEFDVSGRVSHVLAVGRDITEIDEYRQTIHRQAFYDGLTGLPNRTLLTERIQQAMSAPAGLNRSFGLMVMDLDHFKEINDTLGHAAGDQLLCEVGRRLQACARGADTVARLGGDEFAMLLQVPRAGLARIAAKFLTALNEPFVIEGRELFVPGSIGIAVYPDDSWDIPTLYKHADSAMYYAKRQGRNHYQFYVQELTAQAAERLETEAALRKALRHGELELYYQPQIEIRTGRTLGAEALLRWNRPGHGVVSPQHFIGIAEACGLIIDIGEWVLAAACSTVASWNRGREEPLQLSVNLSPRQFLRNDLVGTVRRQLQLTGCQPAWLKLEITESLLLDGDKAVAGMLAELNAMGLQISIDDFGTGYSSLSYLHRFPVTQLKIDRSFVCDVPADRSKSELVKAMLSIAAALRLETVAEGVETEEQADYLAEHGCCQAQGYLFGKPMPREAFDALLAGCRQGAKSMMT
jgi:diguanylate cyclase (GGDEF)-like protein/PAS domain S-box-containing protein